MKSKFVLAAAATLLSGAMAYAQDIETTGDPAAGEAAFRQCAACHNVVNEAGDVLAGRPNMRTGPNLYGQMGNTFGEDEEFRWSPGLQALNEQGVQLTEENFVAYIQDPTGFIREATGDDSLRGAMAAQRLRGDTAGADLYAYLVSLAE
ncbi:c-type cytochrome [Roseibacterium sp. SDUM158017]|uniref:c-type cytochrome n=1 Tax=Roseicyclus salinarum TaxID=3036773 RepID=UPI00241583CE|nr:c-type cytochrome [Roseibacterium sp. SDUM158017]MDG4646913.1 c-type cytochrome [Roseibacterium sp. SDUM158017]